jgi:hypothetical protein
MTKLDEVIAKAKATTTSLKAAKEDYKTLPGYKDYEVNSALIVRSKKTGKVQQIPKGKKKYLLFNDKGGRSSIGPDEIKSLVSFTAVKKAGAKREGTAKEIILALHAQGKTAKQICEKHPEFKYNSVYIAIKVHTILSLHKKGLTPKLISEKTGFSEKSIVWQINK